MSVTSFTQGQAAKLGFRFNTNAWNSTDTEGTLTTGDRQEMLFNGMPRTVVEVDPDLSAPGGPALQRIATKSLERIEGTIPIYCGYVEAARPAAGFFGTEAVSVISGASYSHLLTLNSGQSGVYATIGWTDNLMPHVIPHAKVQSLEFDWQMGKSGILTYGIIGKKELTSGAGNNSFAGMNSGIAFNSTRPATQHLILNSSQCVVRIADTTDALAAGDKVYPTALSLYFRRSYSTYTTSRNCPFMDEPLSGDWYDIGGVISLPYEDATTHRGWMTGNTELLLDIVFTGDQIGATGEYYKWTFEFPSVQVSTEGLADMSGPGLLPYSLPFKAKEADSNPAGMAFTLPRLTIQDHISTSHLTSGT